VSETFRCGNNNNNNKYHSTCTVTSTVHFQGKDVYSTLPTHESEKSENNSVRNEKEITSEFYGMFCDFECLNRWG